MRGTEHYHAARMRDNQLEYFRGFAPGGALSTTDSAEKAYTFATREVATQFRREQNDANVYNEFQDGYWFIVRRMEA